MIAFQKMVLDISFEFMNINQVNFDEKVDHLLERLGTVFEVDRTYIFTVNHEDQTMTYSHEWRNDGIPSAMAEREDIPLINQGIKSSVSVPVMFEGRVQAFIGIDSVKSQKKWSDENVDLLNIMAQILSRGIAKINYDRQIDFMAYYDLLTKPPNQSLLAQKLNKGIARASRSKILVSVLFIDLDDFKAINDALGHEQGDQLLKQVAERLLSIVTKSDTVCRRGGDEFIIYLNSHENEEAEVISSQIVDLFKQPFILKAQEYFITASIGMSKYPADSEDMPTLIKHADMAMYEAKNHGKNQYVICSEQLKRVIAEKIALTNDLYYVIKRDQMTLHYQPQVRGAIGQIIGVETLLRWKHPEYGFIPPFKFIPIAEQTRLILPIGYWVLKTACHQLKEWQEDGCKSIKLAVNFSAHQLNYPNVIKKIEKTLDKTAVEPEYLEIEITESVAIDDAIQVKETLKEIKDIGISLSIDDYGKQYSSLNRLKGEFMDSMTVDMSFIHGIGVNPKDEIIIKSILSLAADLDLETVAEGVETQEQVDFLNKTSCDRLQGYYFHKPMPADEIGKLLLQNRNE